MQSKYFLVRLRAPENEARAVKRRPYTADLDPGERSACHKSTVQLERATSRLG